MTMQDNRPAETEPVHGTAYGSVFRERGTMKLVIAAVVLGAIWLIYSQVHTSLMKQVKWPVLKAQPQGLTVLGLRDKDRPGWRHKYEAIEANHAWQIRRPDDLDTSDTVDDPNSPEAQDRGLNPGATHHVNRGEVVPVEEILRTCPVVLTGDQFTGASVEERTVPVFDRKYYVVHVNLTEEGASRYWQYSNAHDKERLAFVLNGMVLTCPRMDSMDVTSLEIQPLWVEADADQLANFINSHRK